MKLDIHSLINQIKSNPNCVIYPPNGIPKVEFEHKIPNDLFDFYKAFGGMQLFKQSNFPLEIMKFNEFVLANPLIIGEICEDDISAHWYKIVNDLNGDYITIDLHEKRLGKCYDSFHETHGLVGQSKIVPYTFFWLEDSYVTGDAYDDVK